MIQIKCNKYITYSNHVRYGLYGLFGNWCLVINNQILVELLINNLITHLIKSFLFNVQYQLSKRVLFFFFVY
jgi:hypothetical protein